MVRGLPQTMPNGLCISPRIQAMVLWVNSCVTTTMDCMPRKVAMEMTR